MAELDSIVLGGGCFWCIETLYNDLKGVQSAISGFAGGHVENPSYRQVVRGNTGHAEVVKVTFDPEVISLQDILNIFFTVHDPTTVNRQGNDVGPQYRSIVLYKNEEQKNLTNKTIKRFDEEVWDDPIVTQVEELEEFYPAEEYHQRYFEKNPNQGYCNFVIKPKVQKFRKKYFDMLKAEAK